jgi:imidazolonepropionase-like amidohydrolase
MPYEIPHGSLANFSHTERIGGSIIADGEDQVLRAAREQLMLGASQLKLMAGGGVTSTYDPLDVTQYTERELRAAVDAAENWGTYVMVHAYTPRAVQQALRAGVKSIEHGQLLDEETVAMMAEKSAWWSLQPFLDDDDAVPVTGTNRVKQLTMVAGTDTAYALAKKHHVNLAWGTDTLFDPKLATRQGAQLAKLTRWFTPAEILIMATSRNAELLALSGPRNPYPGPLGVIEPGAHADLLLVDGNPLHNIDLLSHPGKSFAAIMKGGSLAKAPTG